MTNLAEGLVKRGHQVTVIYPSNEVEPIRRELNGVQLQGVRTIRMAFIHPDLFVPTLSVKAIRKIFDIAQPEIVHIQDHYPLSRLTMSVAGKRGIQLIGTNHFMPENLAQYIPGASKVKPLYNWALWKWMLDGYNRMSLVTAQSRAAANLIRAKGLKPPAFPVSCGIDLGRFRLDGSVDRNACRARYGLEPNRTVFLYVGRIEKDKRINVLLHAMKLLKREDIQLAVAGRGSAMEYYRALTGSLDLGGRVRFTGFIPREDLHVLLNSVDVFTMPSDAELLSLASLEAMACGRPLLLADAVALPELVAPGVNGYLFKPGDAEDAARHMQLLADQPEKWKEMGKASMEKAQVHGLENTISRYEEIYIRSLEKIPVVAGSKGTEKGAVKPVLSSKKSALNRRGED